MTTRTDIHRPSAIQPHEYVLVGFDYLGSTEGEMWASLASHRDAFRQHRARTGGTFSGHEHGGTCHVCGATALYIARFWHRPSNTYICTGEDCAEKLDMGDAAAFRQFRDAAAKGREAIAGKKKARAALAAAGLERAWDVYTAPAETDAAMTLKDIVGKLVRFGSISDKQMAFVGSLLDRIARAPAIAAQRAAEAEAAAPVPVSGARMLVEGKVLTLREPDESAAFPAWKMLVMHNTGWKVWGSVPGSLCGVKVGDRVRFEAAIKVSDRDPKFGFYSRPTKAAVA
jgi:hypothetical protein